ncbi:hypothetical protein J8F10_13315 [Gemmata sp. G18]|uniref:Uncharacterized protein n=1 Tax=Gemmata palustris TaxID=2822762 RepID=A0ABS5BTR4_9BACT|nr:hypothetical protein [Gemmata palustris]MBP3956263.1 hypothetical protein [Gemmata palustris]
MARIELTFPLSPDECTARLAAATNRGYMQFFESEPKAVYGYVGAERVRVWKRIESRNSFQMCLSGTFEALGGVTVFRGRVGRDVSSWWALATYAMSILVNLFVLIVAANSTASGISRWMLPVFLFMIVVGTFRLWRDWQKARDEAAFLVEFLTRTLGGTVCAHECEVEALSP